VTEQSAKDRVYAAADTIAVDRNPTVATVREEAAVSNGDATRYLKQWRDDRASSGATIAALPQPLAELALRLAGGMWAEASKTATAQHSLVEASWRDEQTRQEEDITELAAVLDTANRDRAEAEAQYATDLGAARAEATEHRADAVAARAELASAHVAHVEESTALAIQLAEARATISTLQDTQTALLARIPDLPTPS
jgi:hypothetical protein